MNLEGSDRLATYKVGTNDELIKDLATTATSEHLELFNLLRRLGSDLVVTLGLNSLELLHALLDLLGSLGETVVRAGGLGLHRHCLHPNVVGLVHCRERHGVATGSVEVDSQESPLTLNCV